jgi:hypothetical protein
MAAGWSEPFIFLESVVCFHIDLAGYPTGLVQIELERTRHVRLGCQRVTATEGNEVSTEFEYITFPVHHVSSASCFQCIMFPVHHVLYSRSSGVGGPNGLM